MNAAPAAGPVAVLIGPPGSGKSTVAALLAHLLGTTAVDTDDEVEQRAGKSVSDIFLDDGEEAFRVLERAAVVRGLAVPGIVLALGGGAILDEETRHDLAGHPVVFLDVSISDAAPRVGFNQARPLLVGNPRARWVELMAARRPIYEALARWTVSTDGRSPQRVAQIVAALVDAAGTGGDEA